ncbi:hypothetical protein KM176_11735 [Pseudooceanicola sp. CBS1P-1]|uniref:Outer membrane beta-barrel protein n=1 Tax=Pseudooceanicola albus TaxID=2692189 RepID=A0A6L7G1K2_9RHOB|nr:MULTISPECIES: hypothetical protein [Pseudooceanicola]MBT9384532.1 hypothetical protein [Pseudooceanicola endophyticus]MXN18234.1 hypothetical protein [Pseudooceanicola albus]
MRTALLLAALAGIVAPAQGAAGAWPRGKGKTFSAGAIRIFGLGTPGRLTQSFTYFHEYGLSDRWTLGADIGGAISGLDKMVVFVSHPLLTFGQTRTAADLGVGSVSGHPVVRPGFSIGRGLEYPPGWAVMETAVEYFLDTGVYDWKVDFTFGVAPADHPKTYLQLQTGKSHQDPVFARLAVSMAIPLRKDFLLDLGGSAALRNSDPYRLKIGFWKTF